LLLSKDSDTQESTMSKKAKEGLPALLQVWEFSDDEGDANEMGPNIFDDPDHPWSRYFHTYLDILEQVPDGWSAIKWWGVSAASDALNIILTYTLPG
jgi:hypothetical protein